MKYYDIRSRAEKLRPVSIVIGGRGIGKTYSALSYLLETGKPFLYLRNTDTQMKESASKFGNPFKRIGLDLGRDVRLEAEGKHYIIKEYKEEKPDMIGYGAALSTFSNLRGVDLSDVEFVLFDEFIERRKLTFRQYDAFMGMYETINRNREQQGRPALVCILLSNSQTLQNPIIQGLGVTEQIIRMIQRGESIFLTRDLYLELPTAEISKDKAESSIYRLSAGSGAAREALENEFVHDSFKNVGIRPLREYVPVCTAWSASGAVVTFYKHKSRQEFYASDVPSWSAPVYDKDSYVNFLRERGLQIQAAAIRQQVFYANFTIKTAAEELLKLT